jgi:hypothetical protein
VLGLSVILIHLLPDSLSKMKTFVDIRSSANTTRGMDFEHMIKREHTREG